MNLNPTDLGRQIDLLVDGELDPTARRALLERLESAPGGWRSCALAFLEAQEWRAAFAPSAEIPTAVPRRRSRVALTLVGMAAGLLAAFALGWSARSSATATALGPAPVERGPRLVESAERTGLRSGPYKSSSAVSTRELEHVPAGTPLAEVATPRQVATPNRHAGFLSPEAARRLQQHGYEIDPPQRRLIALELRNGQRVAVPVEEVRLHYVRDRTF